MIRKFYIYPTNKQKRMIKTQCSYARKIHNLTLEWWIKRYDESNGKHKSVKKIPNLDYFIYKFPYLQNADYSTLKFSYNKLLDYMTKFYEASCKKWKKQRLPFPKFLDKKKSSLFYYLGVFNVSIEENYVVLPFVGEVELKDKNIDWKSEFIKGFYVGVDNNGNYFLKAVYDSEFRQYVKGREYRVGLDMNLYSFIVSSNKEDNENIKYKKRYKLEENKIKRLKRQIVRKKNRSKNKLKLKSKLDKLIQKIKNRRLDFIRKTAYYFATRYKSVVIEDINVKSIMAVPYLRNSMMEMDWETFKKWLKWECFKQRSNLIIANKWFASSKICHHCGYRNKKLKLFEREWKCPKCGRTLDRDYNAACNLRDYDARRNK